jgi:excisionase family DNA binding protein
LSGTTADLKLYTVKDAAAALALAPRTVRDLIAGGELDAVNVGRGTKLPALRIPATALAAFIDARQTKRGARA